MANPITGLFNAPAVLVRDHSLVLWVSVWTEFMEICVSSAYVM